MMILREDTPPKAPAVEISSRLLCRRRALSAIPERGR